MRFRPLGRLGWHTFCFSTRMDPYAERVVLATLILMLVLAASFVASVIVPGGL